MDFTKFIINNFVTVKSMMVLEDPDPLGRPVWSFRATRRPSQDGGEECNPGETGKWEMINTKDTFQIKVEAFKYEPEEISVNRDPDNHQDIIVWGKRLDKESKQVIPGTEFARRFSLPSDVDFVDLNKIYSATGVVIIEAPKRGKRN